MAHSIDVFIDESGDFGPLDEACPYYIVTMVFHESENSLFEPIRDLEYRLSLMNRAEHCIHSSPAIRGEHGYHGMPLAERRRIVALIPALMRKAELKWKCFMVPKPKNVTSLMLLKSLHAVIDPFILANFQRLERYSAVIVSYDRGQQQISQLITETFESMLHNVQVMLTLPIQSRLFQVADFICTMKRMEYKLGPEGHGLAKSESFFFGSVARFRRDWLAPLAASEWKN